ncbi:unnamed protein product [Coregonus sp. 'balchen']|nr:unnamed protein product [Coregonus sp. 'balchen']
MNEWRFPLFISIPRSAWRTGTRFFIMGMASTTPVAALYFIALMTFGNYVLFNLLVAILVEGFQTEVN